MKHHTLAAMAAGLGLAACALAQKQLLPITPLRAGILVRQTSPDSVPDEVLVRFGPDTDRASAIDMVLDETGGQVRREPRDVPGLYVATVPPGLTRDEAIALCECLLGVEYAEPNYIDRAAFTPNDTFFSRQWHLSLIGGAAGIEQRLGLRYDGVGLTPGGAQCMLELKRPERAAGIQDDRLSVRQVRSAHVGDVRVSHGGHDHHHHVAPVECLGRVRGGQRYRAEAGDLTVEP